MRTQTHQGQCDRCRVCWTWERKVLLRDQRCPECQGPLRRIRHRQGATAYWAARGFTWMAVEGLGVTGTDRRAPANEVKA